MEDNGSRTIINYREEEKIDKIEFKYENEPKILHLMDMNWI